jgi:hypothetical protein
MTPKEKAEELVDKFRIISYGKYSIPTKNKAKKCALIAVDEIIIQWEYIDTYLSDLGGELNPNLKYWYNVKQEIEKL